MKISGTLTFISELFLVFTFEASKLSANTDMEEAYSRENGTGVESVLETTTPEACYQGLGCFGLEYPWVSEERPFRRLPDSPANINTTFYLSTRRFHGRKRLELRFDPVVVIVNNATAAWDPRRWTVFLTHGFKGNARHSWVRTLESALLKLRDLNVVSCDWSAGSSGINYVQAAVNARVVGAQVARLIGQLIDKKLATRERIHLIGQSLGAHVMSYVSADIKNIARLTALDPAQPGFEGAHPDTRVDPSDADFVDVIHTSADHFVRSLGLGMMNPIGHVDFFVNGGKKQPGCLNRGALQYIAQIPGIILDSFADVLACSHQRSWKYYIEALQSNCSFWGRRLTLTGEPDSRACSLQTCQQMGRNTPLFPARGAFYVKTDTRPPYCIPDPFSDYVMTYHRFGRTRQESEKDTLFDGV